MIGPETSFEEYYSTIESDINHFYDHGYYEGVFSRYRVTCYNVDKFRNKKIKITLDATSLKVKSVTDLNPVTPKSPSPFSSPKGPGLGGGQKRSFHSSRSTSTAAPKDNKEKLNSLNNINPISEGRLDRKPKPFCTFDLETVAYKTQRSDEQVPVVITMAYHDTVSAQSGIPLKTKLFNINYLNLGVISMNKLVLKMFKDYFEFVIDNKLTLHFAHNLGGFDGIFLFKYLNLLYGHEQISVLMDKDNKFISIKLKVNKTLIIE
ncbi:MAG: hypothetical protein WDN66_03150 [Candidatus Saccharibacteria bacterium]